MTERGRAGYLATRLRERAEELDAIYGDETASALADAYIAEHPELTEEPTSE